MKIVGLFLLSCLGWAQPRFTSLDMDENFDVLDRSKWSLMSHTFGCNESSFNPSNVLVTAGALNLKLDNTATSERLYSGAEVKYENQWFSFGRFTVRMKPARGAGIVSSFFLFRWNPWQEIDIEFVGHNTRIIQFNVFYNPGKEGDPNNEPIMEPIQVELPFDAADDFHDYTIEWKNNEITWYIDGKYYYKKQSRFPIPQLPMTLRMNVWPVCDAAKDWAGKFDPKILPVSAQYDSIQVWQ